MGAKIKISYEKPEELKQIVAMLSPVMRSCKVAKGQQGRYKKAYVEIEGIADKMPQESERGSRFISRSELQNSSGQKFRGFLYMRRWRTWERKT